MHCNDEALMINNLETQLHVKRCRSCQQRFTQLKALKLDADQLPLYQPSEFAWAKVKASIPKKKKSSLFTLPVTIAASFVIGVIVTLVANQAWQEHTIEQLVLQSNTYEKQLVIMHMNTALIGNALWEISQIDEQLNLQQTNSTQKRLWQKRNKVFEKVLATRMDKEVI